MKRQRLRRRYYQCHRLATEPDLGILKHAQLLARDRVDRLPFTGGMIGQPVGVEVGEHEQHAGHALSRRGVDCGDATGWHSAVVRRRVY